MLPLTILVSQKISDLLTTGSALVNEVAAVAASCNATVPSISPSQVVLTSASPDISDRNVQLTYPRICLYSVGLKNTQVEKFRSLSGSVSVIAEIWASANLVEHCESWVHFYTEAVTNILRRSIGDWGDGVFFPGVYDVQFQSPKVGGLGYVESAKLTCSFTVSRS